MVQRFRFDWLTAVVGNVSLSQWHCSDETFLREKLKTSMDWPGKNDICHLPARLEFPRDALVYWSPSLNVYESDQFDSMWHRWSLEIEKSICGKEISKRRAKSIPLRWMPRQWWTDRLTFTQWRSNRHTSIEIKLKIRTWLTRIDTESTFVVKNRFTSLFNTGIEIIFFIFTNYCIFG